MGNGSFWLKKRAGVDRIFVVCCAFLVVFLCFLFIGWLVFVGLSSREKWFAIPLEFHRHSNGLCSFYAICVEAFLEYFVVLMAELFLDFQNLFFMQIF